MRLCSARLDNTLSKWLYNLGYALGLNPWRYILCTFLLTTILTTGVVRFKQENNPRYTFTDSDSPSYKERKIVREFLGVKGNVHFIDVLVSPKSGGNLLRKQELDDLQQFLLNTTENIAVKYGNSSLTYQELCEPYCFKNEPLIDLIDIIHDHVDLETGYPQYELGGHKVFVGDSIYNVTVSKNDSSVEAIGAVVVHFVLSHEKMAVLTEWEQHLVAHIESNFYSTLRIGASSDELIRQEVQAMGMKSSRGLLIALAILIAFLIICSLRYDLRESKWSESLFGAAIPVLVMVTTVGAVSATGYAFQTIVVAVMFLVLAIAIDDVFLMIAAWHRTDKSLSVAERTAEMVEDSGSSMTVTSLTNLISFGNGVFSTTPVLQCFAIYGSVASIFSFVFQIVLFPCIMALGASRENRTTKKSCLPSNVPIIRKLGRLRVDVCRSIAKAAVNPYNGFFTLLVLLGYWALSVYGLTLMETELAIQHLAPARSPLVKMRVEFDEIVKQMQTVVVVVRNPGDLTNSTRLQRLNEMVRAFETASHSYGNESTIYWIRDLMEEKETFSYTDVEEFLEDVSQWHALVKTDFEACKNEKPECVKEFMFSTGFTDFVRYSDVYQLVTIWRSICRKYSEFDAYAYTERSDFSDSSASLIETIWWTIVSEVVCMVVAFVFFIPNLHSILAATFALFSVNIGVLGFLNLWGVGVDPFSLASLLMSIGFSVDICAHISYHYYQLEGGTAQERIERTLSDVGWATTQGALSTVLAMTPTVFWDSYLLTVFFKTVILVNTFGILHGLYVLPVLLGLLSRFEKEKAADVRVRRTSTKRGTFPENALSVDERDPKERLK